MFVSADMQKVMMMPFMRGVKTCVFTNRLVAFHETFAPLGQQAEKKNPQQVRSLARASSGISAMDATSAFVKAVRDKAADAKDITIRCDNCSGQNKNWILFTSMVRLLNDNSVPLLNSVTCKYLETGHTFMS